MSFEESSRSAGRIRLPPPARRYEPISVIAETRETVPRSNSVSIAARSSRSRSKTSFTVNTGATLNRYASLLALSVGAVIGKLHIDTEIILLQQCNRLLQGVAVLSTDADYVALDRCL